METVAERCRTEIDAAVIRARPCRQHSTSASHERRDARSSRLPPHARRRGQQPWSCNIDIVWPEYQQSRGAQGAAMRIRQASALTLVLALAVAGTGCQAKVSDAAGDGGGGPDLVEATVDYTTARTTLTVRYADAASEDLVVTNYWQISTDGDTEPELDAFIGFPGQGGPDRWVVRGYAGSSPDICKSFVKDR